MHSVASASSPLIMTLRHIFTDEASPIRSENTLSCMPSGPASSAKVCACGPPSSIGELKPWGGTLVMTAAST